MRTFLRWLLRSLYGFRALNEAVLQAPGPVLLLPNHLSWWDWLLIGVCLDPDWRFVTSSTTAQTTWVHRWLMVNRRTFPVDMTSPYAVKRMAEYLQRGGRLVLFPEGRLSVTGSLMKLFDGTGFLIFKTRPKVITAYLRGVCQLPFSRNPGPKSLFPRLSVHFSDLLCPPRLEQASATEARARLTDWLRDQMVGQQFEAELAFGPASIPEAILAAARQMPSRVVVQDITLQELTYRRLWTGANVLASVWSRILHPEASRVGVLLPNVNAFPVTLLSLWLADRVPAILNYTTGPAILLSCARLAGLRQIITARSFLERSKLELQPLQAAGIEVLFLEEVRTQVSAGQKLAALLRARVRLPSVRKRPAAREAALVLFTSGSEGNPKGVELTHRNLLANVHQMLAVIDLPTTDRFFNALPLFHSFGLTVGLLLPLVRGLFTFLYLSPLHYRVVPSAFYNLNCTLFFGTNTFLAGYARKAHPYDFRSLRYLVAGAEKIQDTTAELWMRKFGVRVLEGYGATECSPCLSVNLPMRPRHGSAGRFLPGIEHRLEPVEGISIDANNPTPVNPAIPQSAPRAAQVGRLFVRGPNVMRGYLNPEANAQFLALGGWYDTGDIVKIDADGFLFILGRLKRFAKISGEMVSLAAVEDAFVGALPKYGLRFAFAVVARPDETKGEKLIAVTNEPRLTLEEIRKTVLAHGLNNIAVPREVKVFQELPRLGSGKINYRELEKML